MAHNQHILTRLAVSASCLLLCLGCPSTPAAPPVGDDAGETVDEPPGLGVPVSPTQRRFCHHADSRGGYPENEGSCRLRLGGCRVGTASSAFLSCRHCAEVSGSCQWCGRPLKGHRTLVAPAWVDVGSPGPEDDLRAFAGLVSQRTATDTLSPGSPTYTVPQLEMVDGTKVDLAARERRLLGRFVGKKVLLFGIRGKVSAEGNVWDRIAVERIRTAP